MNTYKAHQLSLLAKAGHTLPLPFICIDQNSGQIINYEIRIWGEDLQEMPKSSLLKQNKKCVSNKMSSDFK